MKFRTLILAVVVVLSTFLISCESEDDMIGNWVTRAYFKGYPRADGASFAINDYGYFGLGKDDDDYYVDFYKYDPVKNSWSRVADFPGTPRAFCASASDGTKGYVGLGYDGDDDLSDFWEYDPEADTWTQIDSFPGGTRRFPTAFSIGSDIYVGAGTQDDDDYYTSDFYKYDGSSWTEITPCPGTKRSKGNAVTLNGKAYIISGYHSGSALEDFWEYDPDEEEASASDADVNPWTQLTDLDDDDYGDDNIARFAAAAYSANDHIYIAVGSNGSVKSSAFVYDPTSELWTQKTSLETSQSHAARQGCGFFVLNGYGYIVGGHSGSTSYMDDCIKFEPDVEEDSDD